MTDMDDHGPGGAVMEREPNVRQAAHSADDEERDHRHQDDQDSYLAQVREASVPYAVNQVILTRTVPNQHT